ncbi:MAG TPA: HAMP domain-containing sensor histidine kinase [Anaerolineales bacterium]|nr:HAMP domain-containing sensor histidine kinase [Anaerolineales bacterium]
MNRNSIRWRLPASYALIALLAALSLGSMMLLVLRSYYADQELEYLHGNATALQPVIAQILQSDLQEVPLQDQIRGLAFLSQAQIRLLDTNGNILADSGVPDPNQVVAVSAGMPFVGSVMFSMPVDPPPDKGPVLFYRSDESSPLSEDIPGEKQIVQGKSADIIVPVSASPYGYGFVARSNPSITQRSSQIVSVLLHAANGRKLGTLEFSKGPSYGADVIGSVTAAWLFASIFAIALAAITGWFISQRVTRPVLALQKATHQMTQGNLAVRVDLPHEKQQEFISLANSFNGMAEQVEQTVSTLRAFVADAAHELHTPLTALQANLELARDEENVSDRLRYMARAQEQGQRLETLVKNLLDLSHIEASDSISDFEPVDIAGLVRELGEQFASRAEQTERMFTMNVADESLQIQGSESQLRQVVSNLLENAFKFTQAGEAISVSLARSTNEVVLTVTDSGIGIPAEDLPHMFERFHRARNASAYPGNGLGLAIVKAIVHVHQGNVVAQSQEKLGTVISMSFPLLIRDIAD